MWALILTEHSTYCSRGLNNNRRRARRITENKFTLFPTHTFILLGTVIYLFIVWKPQLVSQALSRPFCGESRERPRGGALYIIQDAVSIRKHSSIYPITSIHHQALRLSHHLSIIHPSIINKSIHLQPSKHDWIRWIGWDVIYACMSSACCNQVSRM